MSSADLDDLHLYPIYPTDDPVLLAQRRKVAERALEVSPETREKIVEETRLQDARGALQRVLEVRKIALGTDEQTKIDTCNDLATLKRWLARAIVAGTAVEALR